MNNVITPLSVPEKLRAEFQKNFKAMLGATGNIFLFAGDQKIEHMAADFWGKGIAEDAADPEHLFRIASKGGSGAFATQLGLIARYGRNYQDVNYVAKLNSKTFLLSGDVSDPYSSLLATIDDVVRIKKESGINIRGVGYTIYLGSRFESRMLKEASQMILQAHMHGLVAFLWVYPRGVSVKSPQSESTVAGAASVAHALGADFVKVTPLLSVAPQVQGQSLVQAVKLAGNTGVICAGGSMRDARELLDVLYHQVHVGGVQGCALGRNIFQRSLPEAIATCKAVSAIMHENASVDEAYRLISSAN